MKDIQIKSFAEYKKAYQESVENPEAFWDNIADKFYWQKKWDKTLEWDFSKPEIKWFQGGKLNIDETEYFRFDVSEANQTFKKNVFRKPFYLIINLALGGNWAGEIDDSIFPAQLYIDYIKYYK